MIGFQCEMCEERLTNRSSLPGAGRMWLLVSVTVSPKETFQFVPHPNFHFCSRACMAAWIETLSDDVPL